MTAAAARSDLNEEVAPRLVGGKCRDLPALPRVNDSGDENGDWDIDPPMRSPEITADAPGQSAAGTRVSTAPRR
jgi:hypothetical protein